MNTPVAATEIVYDDAASAPLSNGDAIAAPEAAPPVLDSMGMTASG